MSPLFQDMPKRTKVVLWIEVIVGIVILLVGIFLIVKDSKAPEQMQNRTLTQSEEMLEAPETSTYISSLLQVELRYPYGWKRDPAFVAVEGLDRYVGEDGFFRVDASNSSVAKKNQVVIKYAKPITIGETAYKYFVLEADPAHLQNIKSTIKFFNQ